MHPAPKQNKTPKIVQIYEWMFQHAELPKQLLPPAISNTDADVDFYWQKFFQLKPNVETLQKELERLDEHRLNGLKPFLNTFWIKCMQSLSGERDRPTDTSSNTLLTLCCLVQTFSKKKFSSRTPAEFLYGIISPPGSGTENGLSALIDTIFFYLTNNPAVVTPVAVIKSSLTLLIHLISAHENANTQNLILNYLITSMPSPETAFDSLTSDILTIPKLRCAAGNEALSLLSWCCNYSSFVEPSSSSSCNVSPCIAKLSLLDDENRLTGYCQVIASSLELEISDFIQRYGDTSTNHSSGANPEQSRTGLMSSIANAVGNWFASAASTQKIDMDGSCKNQMHTLLALYYAVNTNRAFMVILLQSIIRRRAQATFAANHPLPVEAAPIPALQNVESHQSRLPSSVSSSTTTKRNSITSLSGGESELPPTPNWLDTTSHTHYNDDLVFSSQQHTTTNHNDLPPSNLFVSFIEYFSIIMHDSKSDAAKMATRFCFMILGIICEDRFVQVWLHDSNICYRVRIMRAPLRHQRSSINSSSITQAPSFFPASESSSTSARSAATGPSTARNNNSSQINSGSSSQLRPLCHTLLDLMQEFMTSHFIAKQFPYNEYMLALAVVQRLIVYQKRNQIRIDYPWRSLWECLCSLLKFVMSQHNNLYQRCKLDTFALCDRVVCIFNLFITCGDHFLQDGFAYDQLYYEIIRQRNIFEDLGAKCCLKPATTPPSVTTVAESAAAQQQQPPTVPPPSFLLHKRSATLLFNHLVNIRGILSHINPKVDAATTASSSSGEKDQSVAAAAAAQQQQQQTSLTEEQVLRMVRSSYATLTLRIPETIDFVEKYVESAVDKAFISDVVTQSMHHARRCRLTAGNAAVVGNSSVSS